MTTSDGTPTQYNIEALLNSGIQPFADLDPDTLAAIGKGIGKGDLAVPVNVSSDGILLDGHQRLKSMLAQGRKIIRASDVRVIAEANRENALEWAVRLNVQRRHLSVEDKARLARQFKAERGWSQGMIAKIFGVSRPAVTQWLAKAPAPVDEPPTILGADGKRYPAEPRPRAEAELFPAWAPKGKAFKSLRTVRSTLAKLAGTEPLGPMSAVQAAAIGETLAEIIDRCNDLQDGLSRSQGGERQHPEE